MKKEQIKNVVIVGLLVIIAGLSIYSFTKGSTSCEEMKIVYKDYHDDLIQIEHDDSIQVTANVIDQNQRLAVYMKSNDDNSNFIEIKLQVLGKDKEEIYVKDANTFIGAKGQNTYLLDLPELDGKLIQEMKLSIQLEEAKDYHVDSSKFSYSIHREIDDTSTMNLSATWKYLGDKPLSHAMGSITLFKSNKVVGVYNFVEEDIVPNEEFQIETVFSSRYGKAIDYDRTEAFIQYYEEVE